MLSSQGDCDNWVYFGNNNLFAMYYRSPVTVDKNNKIIKIWFKKVFTEKGKSIFLKALNNKLINEVSYSVELYLINYDNRKHTINHIVLYSKTNEMLTEVKFKDDKWLDITKNSFVDLMCNEIIKKNDLQ